MKQRIRAADVPEGGVGVFEIDGEEVAVFHRDGRYRALGHRCPHVRGPLSLGEIEGNEVICPWHGARFDLDCGKPTRGPADEGVAVYTVRRIGDEIEIEAPVAGPRRSKKVTKRGTKVCADS